MLVRNCQLCRHWDFGYCSLKSIQQGEGFAELLELMTFLHEVEIGTACCERFEAV